LNSRKIPSKEIFKTWTPYPARPTLSPEKKKYSYKERENPSRNERKKTQIKMNS
jgi:hypothetical protein